MPVIGLLSNTSFNTTPRLWRWSYASDMTDAKIVAGVEASAKAAQDAIKNAAA